MSTNATYLIWSNEHKAWWSPNRIGYTNNLTRAGIYTHDDAIDICIQAARGWHDKTMPPPELPVRTQDAWEALNWAAATAVGPT